ncbi:MAG: DUF2384 domain-containing protein [Acidobacteriaceae bacterium]|nr:DUF2384 domain-containing protein [Acidobacteriaceae bacterium]
MLTTQDRSEIRQLIHQVLQEDWTQRLANSNSLVDVTARATEVFGTADKAIRWLTCPVRALSDNTPLSLLDTEEGVTRVKDVLGQIEHGLW